MKLPIVNHQPAEPLDCYADGRLYVHSIWPTIQGEGPFVGNRAIFVRLWGCNIQCPACDTEYTANKQLYQVNELMDCINQVQPRCQLVVITGGEPFRQNIAHLAKWLVLESYAVQIETNGTLFNPDFPYDKVSIVCSPKTAKIHPQLVNQIDCLKYIGRAGELAKDGLPIHTLGNEFPVGRIENFPRNRIYLQPCDDGDPVQNSANVLACVESVMEHGYILSLQTHKILGVK